MKTMIDFTNTIKDKTAYFSEDEVETMLDYCIQKMEDPNNKYDEAWYRNYALILTLYRTGRRITEVLGDRPFTNKVGLRPCDLHQDGYIEWDILKKNHIKTKTKTGQKKSEEKLTRARLAKMPKRVLKPVDENYFKFITEYISRNDIPSHERIFPINRRRADQIIKEIAFKCKITRPKMKIHCHMFRHSFAIHLLKKNPNDAAVLRQVQEILDHSSIDVTMAYAQFTQEDKKDMLNKSFGVD